jgi:hypothetical protein
MDNNFNLKQYLSESKLLQEIKVKKPGIPFYFEQDKDDDESYYYEDREGGYYYFMGDDYLIMNSHLNDNLGYDDMEFAPSIDEKNPEEIDDLINFIKDIDPEYNIDELKNMIDNFRRYKIPIYEFDLQGDGGYIFVNLTIRYQDIIPYIKK